jgi:hypothetical protein
MAFHALPESRLHINTDLRLLFTRSSSDVALSATFTLRARVACRDRRRLIPLLGPKEFALKSMRVQSRRIDELWRLEIHEN